MMLLSINLVYMLQAEPFEKNNFDLLWHYIRYITKGTTYKIKTLTVVIYFYSFPACYLKIYLHWVFSTFNYLSNEVNLKSLSLVVCLQQFDVGLYFILPVPKFPSWHTISTPCLVCLPNYSLYWGIWYFNDFSRNGCQWLSVFTVKLFYLFYLDYLPVIISM